MDQSLTAVNEESKLAQAIIDYSRARDGENPKYEGKVRKLDSENQNLLKKHAAFVLANGLWYAYKGEVEPKDKEDAEEYGKLLLKLGEFDSDDLVRLFAAAAAAVKPNVEGEKTAKNLLDKLGVKTKEPAPRSRNPIKALLDKIKI